jgi:[ribosomal protein S5]-alanine N-acetyltransferase
LSDGVVRLRPPRVEDAGWIAEAVADPEVPRWTRISSPYTKDDAFAWVALAESMAREGSAQHLLVADATRDAPLGSVGLEVHARPALHGEIGYWIAAPARRRGAATRAVRLLSAWALAALALPSVELHVLPENVASRAVALSAGFEPAGDRLEPFHGRIEQFDVYVLPNVGGAAVDDRPEP